MSAMLSEKTENMTAKGDDVPSLYDCFEFIKSSNYLALNYTTTSTQLFLSTISTYL